LDNVNKGLIELYFEKFLKFFGVPATILSIALGILLWIILPDETVRASIVISISVLLIALIFPLVMLTFDLFNQIKFNRRPNVLTTFKYQNGDLTILLSKSDLFWHDSLVSIYIKGEENFEQLIAFGSVINIQEDGNIQIGIIATLDGNEDTMTKIGSKNIDTLKRLVVKPNVSKAFIQLNNRVQ
jgi:hypothetical protein